MIVIAIPMALPSAANLREHWAVKARRVKGQRAAVVLAWRAGVRGANLRRLQEWQAEGRKFVVTLIRQAPRKLDDDNLASAFKGIRDQVAAQLGIDDGSPRVAWRYEQQAMREPYVVIHIEGVAQPHVHGVAGAIELRNASQTNGKAPPGRERKPGGAGVAERIENAAKDREEP